MKVVRTATSIGLALTALLLSGCITTGSSGSRGETYESLNALVGDSAVVAEVKVTEQTVDTALAPMTLSTAEVVEPFAPEGLASTLESSTTGTSLEVESGASVTIRQLGTPDMTQTPAPLLKVGESYLVFLRPTELKGDPATTFYIVGGDAGIYSGSNGSYQRYSNEHGDILPDKLTADELAK